MLKNTQTIQPNKSLNLSVAIGESFQKRKKPNMKSNTKKKKQFMIPTKITQIKFKSTKKE